MEVVTIARPNADPHRVEVLPSYMVRVARAQVYLKVGLGLDQWADAIVEGSHNGKIVVVDCSNGVDVLEKPTGKVDASMGDVHPDGNPHYWLDPSNAAVVARNIAAELARLDAANGPKYAKNAETFAVAAQTLAAQRCSGHAEAAVTRYHHLPPLVELLRARLRTGSRADHRAHSRDPADSAPLARFGRHHQAAQGAGGA